MDLLPDKKKMLKPITTKAPWHIDFSLCSSCNEAFTKFFSSLSQCKEKMKLNQDNYGFRKSQNSIMRRR